MILKSRGSFIQSVWNNVVLFKANKKLIVPGEEIYLVRQYNISH